MNGNFLALFYMVTQVVAKIEFDRLSKRIIETKYGRLRGILVEFPGSAMPAVEAYLGIEYGSLLGGSLRFMPPTGPVEKWRGIRLANAFKPVCPQKEMGDGALAEELPSARIERLRSIQQFVLTESEECLYLNIYVPIEATSEGPLPIMVFIHGESYDFGTGNAYDGSVLASTGAVIVVTLNYRLGPLGFLGGSDGFVGNYAVFDLIAALHWIKANIGDFGGDNQKVTLFGQGYGAALAHVLALTPAASGKRINTAAARAPASDAGVGVSRPSTDTGMRLFHRVIMQSGSALCSWAMSNSPNQVDDIAKALNCTESAEPTATECLKKTAAKAIMNAAVPSYKFTTVFGPLVDGKTVLLEQPAAVMMTQAADVAFSKTEMLLGVTRFEGLVLLSQKLLESGVSVSKRKSVLRTYIRNLYEYHRQEIYDILMHQYSDWEAPIGGDETEESIKRMLVEILGDGQYNVPLVRTGLAHSSFHDTFFYVFGHSSEQDRFPEWSGGGHGEDAVFAFGAPLVDALTPFSGGAYTRNERLLSEAVIRLWTNFAKTGNPNFPVAAELETEKNRFLDTFWPKYEQRRQEYLHIGMRPAINHHYRSEMISVWLDLIPKLQHTDKLTPLHHLLKDHENASTFEVGTRGVDIWNIALPPPPSPPLPPFRAFSRSSQQTSIVTIAGTYETPSTTTDRRETLPSSTDDATTTTAAPSEAETEPQPKITQEVTTAANFSDIIAVGKGSEEGKEEGVSVSLAITIGVGCTLLFVNAFIFAGVYFQKNKMRQEREAAEAAAAAATPAGERDKTPQAGGALDVGADEVSLTARTNAIFEAYSRTKEAAAREERTKKAAALAEMTRQAAGRDDDFEPRATSESRRSSGSSFGRAHSDRHDGSDGGEERRCNYETANGYDEHPSERKVNGYRHREQPSHQRGERSPSPEQHRGRSPPPGPFQAGGSSAPREMLIRTPTPRARSAVSYANAERYDDADHARARDPRSAGGDFTGERVASRYDGPPERRRVQEHGQPHRAAQRRPFPREGGNSGTRYYNDELPLSDDSYSGDSQGRTPRQTVAPRDGGAPYRADYNGRSHHAEQHWSSSETPEWRAASSPRKAASAQDYGPPPRSTPDAYREIHRSKVYGGRDRDDSAQYLPLASREEEPRSSYREERFREPTRQETARPRYNAGQHQH